MSVVRDHQYLLAHNRFGDFHPGAVDGQWGPSSRAAVRRAKYALGYQKKGINDHFGPMLYAYLRGPTVKGGKRLTPFMLLRRKARLKKDHGHGPIRDKLVHYAQWGLSNTRSIHYAQIRPYPRNPLSLPQVTDCSGFDTNAYKYAGGPDPNGRNFDGQGWTGTLLEHGKEVSMANAKAGDLVIFGRPPGHHVAMVTVPSRFNPTLVSHGQESDPREISFQREWAGQHYVPVSFRNYLGD